MKSTCVVIPAPKSNTCMCTAPTPVDRYLGQQSGKMWRFNVNKPPTHHQAVERTAISLSHCNNIITIQSLVLACSLAPVCNSFCIAAVSSCQVYTGGLECTVTEQPLRLCLSTPKHCAARQQVMSHHPNAESQVTSTGIASIASMNASTTDRTALPPHSHTCNLLNAEYKLGNCLTSTPNFCHVIDTPVQHHGGHHHH